MCPQCCFPVLGKRRLDGVDALYTLTERGVIVRRIETILGFSVLDGIVLLDFDRAPVSLMVEVGCDDCACIDVCSYRAGAIIARRFGSIYSHGALIHIHGAVDCHVRPGFPVGPQR